MNDITLIQDGQNPVILTASDIARLFDIMDITEAWQSCGGNSIRLCKERIQSELRKGQTVRLRKDEQLVLGIVLHSYEDNLRIIEMAFSDFKGHAKGVSHDWEILNKMKG